MIARMTPEQISQFRERRADNACERRANNRANGTTFGAFATLMVCFLVGFPPKTTLVLFLFGALAVTLSTSRTSKQLITPTYSLTSVKTESWEIVSDTLRILSV